VIEFEGFEKQGDDTGSHRMNQYKNEWLFSKQKREQEREENREQGAGPPAGGVRDPVE
jgi:hypothetical protein